MSIATRALSRNGVDILCGDATVLSDIETVLGGELADMCFSDPPYNVNYANSADKKRRSKNRPILNDLAISCSAWPTSMPLSAAKLRSRA